MDKVAGGIGWFEVGTTDPEGAQRFYGELFGWTFRKDEGAMDYREITTVAGNGPAGGVYGHSGELPTYAIFYVKVDDVGRTVERAEELGGKVLLPAVATPDGLVFAHLADADGSRFGVYSAAE